MKKLFSLLLVGMVLFAVTPVPGETVATNPELTTHVSDMAGLVIIETPETLTLAGMELPPGEGFPVLSAEPDGTIAPLIHLEYTSHFTRSIKAADTKSVSGAGTLTGQEPSLFERPHDDIFIDQQLE